MAKKKTSRTVTRDQIAEWFSQFNVVYTDNSEASAVSFIKTDEEKHECQFHSACCDAPPAAGMYETGRCGRCGGHTSFDCGECGQPEERGNTIRGVK